MHLCLLTLQISAALLAALLVAPACAAESDQPQILVLGDSISKGYFGVVQQALAGTAVVSRPSDNCRHTAYTLEHLDNWLGDTRWDLITWNNGLWDARLMNEEDPPKHEHEVEVYAANLRAILTRLQQTGARILFVNTTPVRWEDRIARRSRRNVDIIAYNAAAAAVMQEAGVPIVDLYSACHEDRAALLSKDGIHFADSGRAMQGQLIATMVKQVLAGKQ